MESRPHILVYTDETDTGGVAQYNHAILCALAAGGDHVTCVQSQVAGPLQQHQARLGIHHNWLEFDTAKDFQRCLTRTTDAEAIFAATRPELVLFSNCCPLSQLAAKRAAVQMGVPFVIVENLVADYLARKFAGCLGELAQQYSRARAVIAVSHENLYVLRRDFGLARDKGQVIRYSRPESYFTPPNAEQRRLLRAEWGVPDDALLCLTVARLELVKGYRYLLQAIRLLQSSPAWPRLYFVWVGGGSLSDQLKEAINTLGIG